MGHIAIEVDDPKKPGGVITIELGPIDETGLLSVLQGSVPGQVNIENGKLPWSFVIPGSERKQSTEQDIALINQAKTVQQSFKDGNLKYDMVGFSLEGDATNCAGFAYDIFK